METFFRIAEIILTWVVNLAMAGFLCALAIALFRLLRRFTVDRLVYSRDFSEKAVYEGDTAELIETIWNPTPFPVFLVDVESYFYDGLQIDGRAAAKGEMRYFLSRFHLMPFERVTKHLSVFAVKRGYYKLSTVSIFRCGDERAIESAAELYVYPRVDDIREQIPSAYGLGDERSRNRLMQDPFSINGIREYQRGDPFGSINFKASARLSVQGMPRFAVNRYEYSASSKYYIYQNFHLPKGGELPFEAYEALMEDGLRMAASLLVRAIDRGGVCAFSANCATVEGEKKVTFPLAGGELHKQDILKEMARTRAMDGVSFAGMLALDILRGMEHGEVFLITSYVDDAIGEQIARLEALGNTVKIMIVKRGAA